MLACRYMVLTNTEIAPLPAPILRSACPLHPSGSPNSRAPPARAPRHIPKPPPTHIPTSPTVPIRVYGVDDNDTDDNDDDGNDDGDNNDENDNDNYDDDNDDDADDGNDDGKYNVCLEHNAVGIPAHAV